MPFYTEKLPGNYKIENATYKRCYKLKRCRYSNKWLFLRKAYFVEFLYVPKPVGILRDVPFKEFYTWIDRDTYITMRLKGEL